MKMKAELELSKIALEVQKDRTERRAKAKVISLL